MTSGISIDEENAVTRSAPGSIQPGTYWYNKNFNPFNIALGDCLVRAVSAALMMRYTAVCRDLGLLTRPGRGLAKAGVSWKLVLNSRLSGYFGRPRSFRDNATCMSPTLREFCRCCGRFFPEHTPMLVFLHANDASRSRHVVCAYASKTDPFFVDTWDSGGMYVVRVVPVVNQVRRDSSDRISKKEFDALGAMTKERRMEIYQNMLGGFTLSPDRALTPSSRDHLQYVYDGEYRGPASGTPDPLALVDCLESRLDSGKLPDFVRDVRIECEDVVVVEIRDRGDLCDNVLFVDMLIDLFNYMQNCGYPRGTKIRYWGDRLTNAQRLEIIPKDKDYEAWIINR